MPFDDEPDDGPGRRGPLPPDDRIWRHPSELGSGAPLNPPGPPGAGSGASRSGGRSWGLAVGSALAGATLTLLALTGLGVLGDRIPIRAVEQVAVPVPREPGAAEGTVGRQAYEAVAEVVATRPGGEERRGTATAYRSDGYLLTAADVVQGSSSVEVTTADGTTMSARLVGADVSNDVAVIQVDATDIPTATLTAGDPQLHLTDRVIALSAGDGWPQAKDVRVGVVSGVRQRIVTDDGMLHGMVEANIDLAGPPPGSPLLSADGAVVGMVTARGLAGGVPGRPGDDRLDLHHATPIDWAKHIADEIVAEGRATHVWVGIEGVDATEEAEQAGGATGARVRRVWDGSPADAADLQEGDVVTAVDGDPVASMSDLVVSLRDHDAGYVADIRFRRAGEDKVTSVRLADRP